MVYDERSRMTYVKEAHIDYQEWDKERACILKIARRDSDEGLKTQCRLMDQAKGTIDEDQESLAES